MKLYGHPIPLDGGGYVVTVICPNDGSYERLMVEVGRIEADAFAPEIALRDGEPATGGGASSNTALFDTTAKVDRELSPVAEALVQRAEADDPQVGDLKAGEAYSAEHNPHAYASATAAMTEQGD